MFLGIDGVGWLFMSAAAFIIMIASKMIAEALKKRSQSVRLMGEQELHEILSKLGNAEEQIEEMTKMAWTRVVLFPEDVDKFLNELEKVKIPVMYQFFFNNKTQKYDMFFRCAKSRKEELEEVAKKFITQIDD